MQHKYDQPFTFSTPDVNNATPDLTYIGTIWQHTGNHKNYMLAGYVWNGDTDEWNMKMHAPEGIEVVRPLSHLFGQRDDGSIRYFQVDL